VVILDNLSTHEIRGGREPSRPPAYGLLYLPPYLRDSNPIERIWSKIKHIQRSHELRTEDDLLLAAKTAIHSISAADCSGFFFWRPIRYIITRRVLAVSCHF
jgi:transposase